MLGMGGSGMAGDVLPVVAGPFMSVPVVVHKGYGLPNFIDEHTLVFAVSFSGDTEETVEAATEAAAAGARLVVVTARRAPRARWPTSWACPWVPDRRRHPHAPRRHRCGGHPAARRPRAASACSPGASAWIDAAVDQLRRRRDQLVADGNPAERLARRIGRLMPIIYGGGGVGGGGRPALEDPVQRERQGARLRQPAARAVPQRDLRLGSERRRDPPGLPRREPAPRVRAPADRPALRAGQRAWSTRSWPASTRWWPRATAPLAQLLDLVLFGDFVTLHRAAQEGIDPGPVPVLDELKARPRPD